MALTVEATSPEAESVVVERQRFVRHNMLTTGSTLVAGALGFGLQAVTSHSLRPAPYGKAFAVFAFFTLLTRPAAAFGRLVAWQTSRERADLVDGSGRSDVLREVTLKLLLAGVVLALLATALGSTLSSYMGVPLSYVIAGAAGVPWMLAVQPMLGGLQGEQRFVPWSALSVLVALSRVALVVPLIYVDGAYGFVLGTTIAAGVTLVGCVAAEWPRFRRTRGAHAIGRQTRFRWRPAIPFIVTAVASTLAIGVFLGTDVVVVEHYFDKVSGGQYAVVTAIGNAVFFASGGVVSAIFPMVAQRHARNRSTFAVMGASLGLCLIVAVVGSLSLQLFGRFVLMNFAGRRYIPGDKYLGWYALGVGLLGCVVVLVNTQQSLNHLSLLWVLVPITVLRPVLLILFHHTLLTVVMVSDLTIAGFGFIMAVMYVVSERARLRPARAPSISSTVDEALSGAEYAIPVE